jgi:hypothetical protein
MTLRVNCFYEKLEIELKGLWLSTVKKIISCYNGEVKLKSNYILLQLGKKKEQYKIF